MSRKKPPESVWVCWSENGIELLTTDIDRAGEYGSRSHEIHTTHYVPSSRSKFCTATHPLGFGCSRQYGHKGPHQPFALDGPSAPQAEDGEDK